jgi:hypothetical protein
MTEHLIGENNSGFNLSRVIQLAKLPIPKGLEKPEHDLEYYVVHDPR